MEKLSPQEREVVKKFYLNTLPGTVVAYLKLHEEVSVHELVNYVSENYSTMRNGTGCRYKGKNIKKVIQGLLSNEVFVLKSDYYQKLEQYESERMESIALHRSRTRIKIKFAPDVSKNKTADRVFLIENFCGVINRDPEFSNIFDGAFKKLKIGDRYEDAGVKVGFERLIGMIQGYEITTKYCKIYEVAEIDKKSVLENYHNGKVLKSLNMIEKRLDKLEALKAAMSDRTGSSH